MASSIRSAQRAAIERMLDLNRDASMGGADDRAWQNPWKVLVYDAYCRDIISPLLTVGDLRKRGITLYLLLDVEREAIPDVPAIYFMQPTASNVRRLGADAASGLYESYYINFSPAVPRPLLEELATATLESDTVAHVSRVMDQYLNFASVEEDFFSLLLPQSYLRLNSPTTSDSVVEATIDAIVQGLFSAVVTLGAVPILRYKVNGGPAQMVAEQLGRRLYDQLKAHPQLFARDHAAVGFQRPLLVIAERSADFSVMLHHAWSYCALCHDLLDLRLNRVTIPDTSEGGPPRPPGGPPKVKSYDLPASDSFWATHMGEAFQTVASDVDKELNDYRAAMEAINSGSKLDTSGGEAALADSTKVLATAISQLPELQAKKQLIDAHMNIATELLSHIRARSIDSYCAIEEALMEGRSLSSQDKTTLPSLLDGGSGGGTPDDRLRLLLLLQLHPSSSVPASDVTQYEATLRAAGIDLHASAYLAQQKTMMQMTQTVRQGGADQATTSGRMFSSVMSMADKVGVGSSAMAMRSALASAAAAGMRQLLPSQRLTPITRAVTALMDNKATAAEEEGYGYLDPKLAPTAQIGGAASRSRNPYTHALCFVVGPGNYLEYQSLRQAIASTASTVALGGRRVSYGCTEICTPNEFVAQLAQLAQ
jgi:hypothetical protein